MPNLNIDVTQMDYWLLIIHKALVGGDTWDEYVNVACLNFPMKAKVYGEKLSFSDHPPKTANNRKVTIRMSKETHARADKVRENLAFTWREFLLYPSQNDSVAKVLSAWFGDSVLGKEFARR